jgi:hypothetical protein
LKQTIRAAIAEEGGSLLERRLTEDLIKRGIRGNGGIRGGIKAAVSITPRIPPFPRIPRFTGRSKRATPIAEAMKPNAWLTA